MNNHKLIMLSAPLVLLAAVLIIVLAVVSMAACAISEAVDYAGDRLLAFVDWFNEGIQ